MIQESQEGLQPSTGKAEDKLRILHLEDTGTDAELVARFLKRAELPCDIRVAATQNAFERELKEFKPHVILSDHSLPQFNSIEALKIARATLPDVAFILVTGTVSEEFAVQCIRNGADDYILKSNLLRLPTAITGVRKEKMAMVKLRESEKLYRQIVETAQEGIWMFDVNGKTLFVNQKMADILEYPLEELMRKNSDDMTQEKYNLMRQRALEGNGAPVEIPAHTRSGERIWLQMTTSAINDDSHQVTGFLAMVTDITERKNAHERLVQSERQIRNFAQHLNKTMEAERGRIAREIHDELGQQLAGIKMALAALKRIPGQDQREDKINLMVKDVDATIQVMRKIATELRPGILDTLGLVPSIEWLAGEFQRKSNVRCETHITVESGKFDNEISICFFRVCQESLTNISKHAEATRVKIEITQNEDELRMVIADNGKGIAGEELDNPFSMGLLGMRERAKLVGAELKLYSSPNKGTTVDLRATLAGR